MAIKAKLNHFDVLSYEDQALLSPLFTAADAFTIEDPNEKHHGWYLRCLPHAFISGINAVPSLATGLAELFKSRYSHAYVKRENTGGNFCGHDPKNPRFIIKNHPYFTSAEIDDLGDKRRPQILYDIVEKVKAYYNDPDVMEVLQNANAHKRTSDKKRRSEARERVISLLTAMLMSMDLSSLRVGQPTKNGGFFNYSIEWLAKKAKLSLSRAERAMSDLIDSTIIHSYQYRELIDKEKKEYIAHNAARVFDFKFFKMLQIDQKKFRNARRVSSKKQKDTVEKYVAALTEKDDAVQALHMQKIMRGLNPKKTTLRDINAARTETEQAKTARLHKKRTEVFLELSQDPRFQGNEQALGEAVQQRLAALNLLTDSERAT